MQKLNKLIRSRFYYEPDTGILYFRERVFKNPSPRNKQWNTRFAGKEAGFLNTNGYLRVSLEGKQYYIHQIAFMIMKDYIPEEVDHKDLNKQNNKWSNLREATRAKNLQNNFKRKNNKTKLKGVSWSKSNNCWRMDITYNKQKFYSYHPTKQKAYQAYCEMSAKLHKEFGCVS